MRLLRAGAGRRRSSHFNAFKLRPTALLPGLQPLAGRLLFFCVTGMLLSWTARIIFRQSEYETDRKSSRPERALRAARVPPRSLVRCRRQRLAGRPAPAAHWQAGRLHTAVSLLQTDVLRGRAGLCRFTSSCMQPVPARFWRGISARGTLHICRHFTLGTCCRRLQAAARGRTPSEYEGHDLTFTSRGMEQASPAGLILLCSNLAPADRVVFALVYEGPTPGLAERSSKNWLKDACVCVRTICL